MKSYGRVYILGACAPLLLGRGEVRVEVTKAREFGACETSHMYRFPDEVKVVMPLYATKPYRFGYLRPRKSKVGPRRQRSVWVLPR